MTSSIRRKKEGTRTSVRMVELMTPPMTVTASGDQRALDSVVMTDMGRNPKTVANVVIKIGRSRLLPASISTSCVFSIPADS